MIERTLTYPSNGAEITVDAYLPDAAGEHPTIVALHGSNGMSNGAPLVRALTRPIVAAGFAVFVPHYFESTGTVRSDFATSRRNFGTWMTTVADAISHVEREPGVASGRIGVVGISLGAFLGLSVSTQDPRIRAMVDFFGGLPDELAASATTMPPTLILHGDADRIVPVAEAHKLRAALEARDVPHEVRIYPGEGHIFSPLAAVDAAGRTMRFLSRHLK
jgi:carboxymethylenebutenolidase